jgi:bifunctional non-homologous end joining protein LigD
MRKPTADPTGEPVVSGIRITHPDRLVYPDLGVTKLDVARFYEEVAERMVPHVAGRPLTLVHCPEGLAAPCRYLRHNKVWGPKTLRRVRIREKTKVGEYLVADDAAGIITLAQMSVLEIHTWNSTADDIERPNRIVWDLDPGPDVAWAAIVAAARQVRDILSVLGLDTWVKTTGGRGLHVVMPLAPARGWAECLQFARAVAEALVLTNPNAYTTTFAKQGRDRKILVDYLRNNRTNTSVAAFSTRARPGAAVSMPIAWTELTVRLEPQRFNVETLPARLRRRGDPWAEYWRSKQRISPRAFKAITSV